MNANGIFHGVGGWDAFRRAGWALAIKTLPALYGIGLILAVIRVIPVADYGRYGIAFAYINLAAVCSRGLWGMPLIRRAAMHQRDEVLGPVIWLSSATAIVGALAALVVLPALSIGYHAAWIAAAVLIILVPRDMAMSLAQAESRLWVAFLLDAGYFLGSLIGFSVAASFGLLKSAEDVLWINLAAALLSAITGLYFYPMILKPPFSGDWSGVFKLGRWTGALSIGEIYLQQGDLLVLGAMVEPLKLAPYIAAKTLLRVYALLSQAVNFLIVPSASRHAHQGTTHRLKKKLRGALMFMWAILVPVNIGMFFFADSLLPGVLGEKYREAVPFFQILMLASFFEPLYSVIANALVGLGKPQKVVILFGSLMVANIVANVSLVLHYGLDPAPWILVGTYICLGLGLLWNGWKQLH